MLLVSINTSDAFNTRINYLFNELAHQTSMAQRGYPTSWFEKAQWDMEMQGITVDGCLRTGGPSICFGPGAIRAIGARIGAVISETLAGTGNITSRFVLTADELLQAGEKFLGSGYKEIGRPGSGVFRSADGTRQFRIDGNSLSGSHAPGLPHGHLEVYAPGAAKPLTNNHIPFNN